MAVGEPISGTSQHTKEPNRGRRLTASLQSLRPLPTAGFALLVIAVSVLFVYPTVMVIVGSLRTSSPGFPGSWSLGAYADAYTDGATYSLLSNSVLYAAAVTVISMVIASFFAWLVTQTNTPGRRLVTPIMVVLIALPFLFFGLSWAMLGNASEGLLNQLLRHVIPVDSGPINIRSWYGIIGVSAIKISAINYMLMLGVFRSLDPALREASRMAGVSRLRSFIRVEIPVLAPLLLSLALMGFVRGLESFDIPLLLGSPAGIQVFSTQIYAYLTNTFPPSYAQASALSVLVMVITAILVVLMWRFMGKRDFTVVGGKGQRTETMDIGRWKYVCSATVAVFALVGLAFPLIELVLGSLQPVYGVLSTDLTLDHFRDVLGRSEVVDALKNTGFIVVVGGFLAVVLATVIAYVVQRMHSKVRWFLEGATWLPWAVPGVVLSLGMLWAYLSVPGLRTLFATIWLVMIGLIVVATPVVVRLANAAIGQVHQQLEEAARVHGASRPRAVVGIVLRLILPSLLAAWLMAGVIMAGDLAVPVLLSGPTSQTVPVVVLQLTESGKSSEAAAVFVLMLGALALALALIGLLRFVGGRILARGRTPILPLIVRDDTADNAVPREAQSEPAPEPAMSPTQLASKGR